MAELQKQQPNGRTTKYTPCRDDDTSSKNLYLATAWGNVF